MTCPKLLVIILLLNALDIFIIGCSSKNNKKLEARDTFKLEVIDSPVVIRKKFTPQNVMPFCDQGIWGYSNLKGEIVIDCKFEAVGFFSEGMAWVKKNSKFGYIDSVGKLVVEFKYDAATNFRFGMAAVKTNTFWGFIDKKGKILLPCQFERVEPKEDSTFHVLQNDQWGLVVEGGKQKILPLYDDDFKLENNLAIVKRRRLFGIIDSQGKIIIECKYSHLSNVKNNLYIFSIKDKYGLMQLDENQLIKPIYDGMEYAGDSTMIVYFQEKDYKRIYGLINFKEKVLLDFRFKAISKGKTNLLSSQSLDNQLFGYLNFKGDTIIPLQYYDAKAFNSKLVQVKRNKWGMINSKNEEIIPFEFDDINFENSGMIKVCKNGFFGFYTNEGKKITDCIYKEESENIYSDYDDYNHKNPDSFSNGLAAVGKDCHVGYIDGNGEVKIPFNYHWASAFDENGIAIVKFNDYYGLINKAGQALTEIKYLKIKRDEQSSYYYFDYHPIDKEHPYNSKSVKLGYFGLDGKPYFNSNYVNEPYSLEKIIKRFSERYNEINKNIQYGSKESFKIDDNQFGTQYNDKLVISDQKSNLNYEYYYDYSNEFNQYGPFFIAIYNTTDKTVEKYYYLNGIMIKHINKDGKSDPVCDKPETNEEIIHFNARNHLAQFNNARFIHSFPGFQKGIDDINKKIATIDADIQSGKYKRGDSKSQNIIYQNSLDETYINEKGELIYEIHTQSGEGPGSSRKMYYLNNSIIYSQQSEFKGYGGGDYHLPNWTELGWSTTTYFPGDGKAIIYNTKEISGTYRSITNIY